MIADETPVPEGDPAAPTEALPGPVPAPPSRSAAAARLPPGHLLAGRYRIVAPLGRGGMGELYRADDLKLDQAVALKRLPPELADDPRLRARLLSEVRIGRQLAHPNLCRLYDVVEAGGERFISMEMIDGEDLASLLRRIGRLPQDKGLVVAKELCAGLAAAHDQGVVHRDLKPANVMLDGRGRARITDLGLAVFADDLRGRRELAGSPAYMSPEQLDRGEVTARSDLYALGLVLYEVFTGRRVFDGSDMEEIRRRHQASKTRPSAWVSDLDPAVERVILACLDEDPARRPASAREVMAALPGGEPLEALLAAGETPSPGAVAAAGAVGELSAGRAWALLGLLAAALALGAGTIQTSSLHGRVREVKPPEVLRERGRQILAATGSPEEPADRTGFFTRDPEYLQYLRWSRAEPPGSAARRLSRPPSAPPGALVFVYRESPAPLIPSSPTGRPAPDDPPDLLAGMATVVLDPEGRLVRLRRVPLPADAGGETPESREGPDWSPAFRAAGLDAAAFEPAEPLWPPPAGSDALTAWTGSEPGHPEVPLRVEAASFRGQPVHFDRIGPWRRPAGPDALAIPPGRTLFFALVALGTIGAAVFARRNQVRGRVDGRGALRIAVFVALADFLSAVATARHVPRLDVEWLLVTHCAGGALFLGFAVWLAYLAVEPYARRSRPRLLIGWSRAVAGRFRDPLVGQEVLIGGVLGAAAMLPQSLGAVAAERLQLGMPVLSDQLALPWATAPLGLPALLLHFGAVGVRFGLGWLTLLVIFHAILRRYEAALLALWLVVGPIGVGGELPLLELACTLAGMAFLVFALHRFGLLALSVGFLYYYAITKSPLTFEISTWFASRGLLVLLCLLGIGLYGFRTALGRRPAFTPLALEREPPAPGAPA